MVVVNVPTIDRRKRMAHNRDPVTNAEGKIISWVTSCAIDSERFPTGQAFIELPYTPEGTPILIYQGGVMDRPATPAKVVSRPRETLVDSEW